MLYKHRALFHLQRGFWTADFHPLLLNLQLHWTPRFFAGEHCIWQNYIEEIHPWICLWTQCPFAVYYEPSVLTFWPKLPQRFRKWYGLWGRVSAEASNSDLNSDGEAVRGTEASLCCLKVDMIYRGEKIALYFGQQRVSVNKITAVALL